jgi:hypothetical protein
VFPGRAIPKGRGALQSFAVVRGVMHPGLPIRRMLPNLDECAVLVSQAALWWMKLKSKSRLFESGGEMPPQIGID